MMDAPTPVPPDRVIVAAFERREAVLEVIRGARAHLMLSLFRCNDKEIFRELRAAVERGVTVEVLVTSRAKGGKKKLRKLWRRLEDTGATVFAYNDPVVKYHAKYLVADDGPALVASLNLTRKCFVKTCDVVVVTHDPAVISGLKLLMAADREGNAAPETLPDRLILGPERARRQFTAIIEQARSSISLVDAKLSDPGILALLEERRAAGVAVRVHDERHLGDFKVHGKIMLVDDERVIVGSLALTALSLDFRREVAIEVTEPAGVRAIQTLFQTLGVTATAPGDVPAAAAGGAS